MVAKLFTVPFAANGDVAPVPDASQLDGSVSYDRGFGADYDRQLGVDPQAKSISRENWNSVQRDVTTALQEMQSGLGLPPFDLVFAVALPGGGYPRAAIVPRSDGAGYWQNQNVGVSTADPTVAGSGWVPLNIKGTFTQALTNVNVTLSPSNAAFHTLILTGALTGNVAITLPAWSGYNWIVDNRCTGAFAVTVLVAAGVPVAVPNGAATPVFCDGTNIRLGVALTQATESVSGISKFATQVLAEAGVDDTVGMTPLKVKQSIIANSLLDTVRVDVASAANVNLTTAALNTRHINITGSVGINGFTVAVGKCYLARFAGALLLTNGANLVTQSGANITTAAGDTCWIRATATNVVEILCYTPGIPQALGYLQTLQNGLARSLNTTYTNNTGRTIWVMISVNMVPGAAPLLVLGGTSMGSNGNNGSGSNIMMFSFPVLNGQDYRINGGTSVAYASEVRL